MPPHTVGTPAEIVTPSASNSATRPCGERSGPGYTSRAPAVVARKGYPHAAAWNIGTTGSTTSVGAMAMLARFEIVWRYVERCVYATPFGFPVVPEV